MFAGVVQRQQRQLLRQPLAAGAGHKIHFLQLADIRLAAGERRDAAAANYFPLFLHHPVGGARLAVQLIQLIEIRVGDRIAFIGGQAIFSRDLADDPGDGGIVCRRNATQQRRRGDARIHTMTHYPKKTNDDVNNIATGESASEDVS